MMHGSIAGQRYEYAAPATRNTRHHGAMISVSGYSGCVAPHSESNHTPLAQLNINCTPNWSVRLPKYAPMKGLPQ